MVSRSRRHESQLAFETLSIEGGLLSPEWLSRVAQLTAGQQEEADYRVPKGLSLRDEIGRYWRIAHAHWQDFAAGLERKNAAKDADARRSTALSGRFLRSLLRESFGFQSLASVSPSQIDGRIYPIDLAALDGRVPVVIGHPGEGVDAVSPTFGDGTRKRSPFGLIQEFLNAADDATWGIVSDGCTLRILRDNSSLTRPAWIEADLGRIFSEERYADFAALWLLAHESRFGGLSSETPETSTPECVLDAWRRAGQEEGTRAREDLREGFKEALLALGQGFLSHPDNGAIRAALQDGSLTKNAYFQQLLRVVYRFIFLLAAEERDALHPPDTSEDARALYAAGYGLKQLRDRSVRRSAHDRFSDLWDGTRIVFRGLADGERLLGLPTLSGLFARTQCPVLDAAKLQNRALLLAVFRLSWLKQSAGLVRVNWRDMGPEELGSVYESLLELVPQITDSGRHFTFATGGESKGSARKTSGSYYTPDTLVVMLLDTALEPVIAETVARNAEDPVEALLRLSVVDPACGSGHFLLAAARRIASHIARFQASGTPSAAAYRRALRQVVGHCIYGVDLNPMAVELCKVSLWMEAVEPGLPLTFLNSHIQHGNALVGTTPDLMRKGIPDEAWDSIESDDKKTAAALKKRNKKAAEGQRSLDTLWSKPSDAEAEAVAREVAELEAASDTSPEALAKKESQWDGILSSVGYRHQKFVADAWCAAFVWPKQPGDFANAAPTNELWRQVRDGQGQPPALTTKTIGELTEQYRFFHWHLQFPQVFAKGGFDVVLGNPPWERVKLQEQEFFASRSNEIAGAANAAMRKKLIAKLPDEDPQLWAEWSTASRKAEGESHFIRQSARYPLCGKGDVNTYAIFAEHNRNILGLNGRAGFIVPSGIATDETTKDYFGSLVSNRQLSSLYDFRNHDGLFYDVGHRRFKFCLLSVLGRSVENKARFVFFAESAEDIRNPDRQYTLGPEDIGLLNPNTGTSPTFRSRHDADINLAMYRRAGIFWRDGDVENGNPWSIRFMAMLHMAGDSGLFKLRAELEAGGARLNGNRFVGKVGEHLPLIEAKMVHHFDHRFGDYADKPAGSLDTQLPDVPDERLADATYQSLPRYWVAASEVADRLGERWVRGWLLGWRDICRSTDERTVIASLIPRAAVGHTTPLMFTDFEPALIACLYSSLCSFAFDYTARQKVGGTHLTYSYLKQLPVLAPATYADDTPWQRAIPLRDFILPRVLELTYTAWDLEPFARDIGYGGPPFRWDPERRFQLRCELDAAFFHLYGLSHHETAYVMDTFPIVNRNDEKAHNEYRTKRVIVERYDEMTEAARGGRSYASRLDPSPADARLSHAPQRLSSHVATVPSVMPALPADQEAALVIWAIIHASGGTIRRSDLARAFTLRSQPNLLRRLAPVTFSATVDTWARTVGQRSVAHGLLAAALKALSDRHGIEMATDAESHSVVRTTTNTPTEDHIDPWYRFEARLVVQVLTTLSAEKTGPIDATIAGADRSLLEGVS